jgi:hypothetical protein
VAPLIVFLLYFQYIDTYEITISRGSAKRLDNKIIKRTFQTLWNTKHAQQQKKLKFMKEIQNISIASTMH